MANTYPNGVGGTLGDTLATCKPLLTSGTVWYVDSTNGVDGAAASGQNREKPLLTLTQAITNSAAVDIIVLLAGYSAILTTVVSLGGRLLIGEGGLTSQPTATIGFDGTTGELRLDAAGSRVGGIAFTTRTSQLAVARISFTASQCSMRNCTLECNGNDTAPAVQLVGALTGATMEDVVFTSTATNKLVQPESAVKSTGVQTDLVMRNVTFDAGEVGFSNYYALDLSTGAHVRMRAEGIALLRGADVTINSGTTGSFNPQLSTGGSRIVW